MSETCSRSTSEPSSPCSSESNFDFSEGNIDFSKLSVVECKIRQLNILTFPINQPQLSALLYGGALQQSLIENLGIPFCKLCVSGEELAIKVHNELDFIFDAMLGNEKTSFTVRSEKNVHQFLTIAFPLLIEIFINRKTDRENETVTFQLFLKAMKILVIIFTRQLKYAFLSVASFTTTPSSLYELRNILLLGIGSINSSFKFIDTTVIKCPPTVKGKSPVTYFSGFYADYGRPNTAIFGSNFVLFWSDEWQRVLGGQKAVGHFVEWYQKTPILVKVLSTTGEALHSSQMSNNNSITNDREDSTNSSGACEITGWIVGQVVGYERDADAYTIQFDRSIVQCSESLQLSESLWEEYYSNGGIKADYTKVSVPLKQTLHHWVDLRYKNRIGSQTLMFDGDERLTFSFADVGKFIKIWWSRYNKHYYGKVTGYDSTKKSHSIHYEDADTRIYDMTSKDYELIFPPANITKQIIGLSDAEAAKIVASWHRKGQLTSTAASGEVTGSDKQNEKSASSRSSFPLGIPRGNAAQLVNVSMHQLAIVSEFAKEGGLDSLFQCHCDNSIPPPNCRVMMLNMQLIYQLKKYIGAPKYQDLVWEVKESIPVALLRYQDIQLKEINVKEFSDVCVATKDIIMSVQTDDSGVKVATPNQDLLQAIDILRLSMAKKLLLCSQLQKRYQGLSMIKDIIETVSNKLPLQLEKRYQLLGVKRNVSTSGKGAKPNQVSAANISSAPLKSSLTTVQVSSWLVENCIINAIFGESLHQDLVAKSDVILTYMAEKGLLNEQHVETIWQATKGAHEAVVRVLYLLILVLVPTLPYGLRTFLFSLIAATPIKDYTEQLLHFIKAFTVQSLIASKEEPIASESRYLYQLSNSPPLNPQPSAALPITSTVVDSREKDQNSSSVYGNPSAIKKGTVVNAPNRQWLGFGVLWQFIQDNPNAGPTPIGNIGKSPFLTQSQSTPHISNATDSDIVDENLIDLGIQLLVDLLHEEFKEERELVMSRCLENVQAGMSVPVSLQLLRKTLALYPSQSRSWFGGITGRQNLSRGLTAQNQIDKLMKTQNLMEIIFKDLEKYHRSIEEYSSALPAHDNLNAPIVDSGIDRNEGGLYGSSGQSRSLQDLTLFNERRVQSNGKLSRTSHLKGIVERLDFLKFVISRSNVRLDESQTMLLWKALGEKASTVETLEKFCAWIDTLVNRENKQLIALLSSLAQENDLSSPDSPSQLAFLDPYSGVNRTTGFESADLRADAEVTEVALGSAFEDGVLVKLFEDCILRWAHQIERSDYLSRPSIAKLCFKLFLLSNILSKSIRVNTDSGEWMRVGSLVGLPVLWRIAMDGSSAMAHSAHILLIELYHRAVPKSRFSEVIKCDFLRQCFRQLYMAVQSSLSEDSMSNSPHQKRKTEDAMTYIMGSNSGSTVNKLTQSKDLNADDSEWFEDGEYLPKSADISRRVSRLVLLLRLFIHRFYFAPTKLITITVLAGRNESAICNLSMKASDTVKVLRIKVAHHFKELPEALSLTKYASKSASQPSSVNATPLHLDRDDLTLQQAKFSSSTEYVLVRKRESVATNVQNNAGENQKQKLVDQSSEETFNLSRVNVSEPFGDLLQIVSPLDWLSAYISRNSDQFSPIMKERLSYEMFVIPPLLWKSHVEMTPVSTSSHSPNSALGGGVTVTVKKSENLAKVHDINVIPGQSVANANESPDVHVVSQFGLPGSGEILHTYLQNSMYYNQLLEMLDGYLATESFKSTATSSHLHYSAVEFNLTVAIWDVLQSLPTYTILAQQVKSIKNGTEMNLMFDSSSPYRLLYTLQLVEALVAQAVTHFCKEFSRAQTIESGHLMDWILNFIDIGGLELMMNMLNDLSKNIEMAASLSSDFTDQLQSRSDHPNTRVDYVMPRKDTNVILVSIVGRIVHLLLLLDPAYKNWVVLSTNGARQSKLFSGTLFDATADISLDGTELADSTGLSKVPAGLALSTVNVNVVIKSVMSTLLSANELFRRSLITGYALLTVADNLFSLLFGILTAIDNGVALLRESGASFSHIVHQLCITCSLPFIRQGFCRRLFEATANIYSKCADPRVSQDEKKSRLKLFDYIYHVIIDCAASRNGIRTEFPSGNQPIISSHDDSVVSSILSSNGEQLYSLIASIEALRSSPNLIFPEIAPKKRKLTGSNMSKTSQDNLPLEDLLSETVENEMIVDSSVISMNARTKNISDEDFKDSISLKQICKLFVHKLFFHKSKERFHSTQPDGTLLSIIRVLLVLTHGDTEARQILGTIRGRKAATKDIITYLYVNGLFPDCAVDSTSSSDGEKNIDALTLAMCQTQVSRDAAYVLLYSLCGADLDNFAKLVSVMCRQTNLQNVSHQDTLHEANANDSPPKAQPVSEAHYFRKRRSFVPWNYDPSLLVKENGAFVGLSNQGGTCYMNSFIQQLYHSMNFADGLLRIPVDVSEEQMTVESATNQSPLLVSGKPTEYELMVFQLQVMFGHLKLSQKRYYDTIPFCRSFIDYDGQPISLGEQKDINEFAGMLFEKMEHNASCKALLANTIKGEFVWKTRSTESSYRSEREESFYMITADVKDKSTLENALELNAAEEIFSGDNKIQDENGQKVEASRRCEIRSLPPTLIIHLKRFEFDIETMNRKKVNDFISFPLELNMFPYTEEGIRCKELKSRSLALFDNPAVADPIHSMHGTDGKNERPSSYYSYNLRGIVAHVGAIDRGHYYSFIKERKTQKWYEFNDRSVIPFNPENIPSECFGGVEIVTNSNGVQTSRMRENSAYLLVYEREESAINILKDRLPGNVEAEVSNHQTAPLPVNVPMVNSNIDLKAVDIPIVKLPSNITEKVRLFEDDETFSYENTVDISVSEHGALLENTKVIETDSSEQRLSATVKSIEADLMDNEAISKRVLEAVWTENIEFQKDRFLFDPIHFRFIWQLLKSAAVNEILSPTSSTENSNLHRALGELCVASLRFNVEVVARAFRAQANYVVFFEVLQDIINKDITNTCARCIVEELAFSPREGNVGNKDALNGSNDIELKAGTFIQPSIHPWLYQVYVQYPTNVIQTDATAPSFPQAFSKFLFLCMQSLRQPTYKVHRTMCGPPLSEHPSTDVNHAVENEQVCATSVLVSQLLRLLEALRLEDILVNNGYSLLSGLILQFSLLGMQEAHFLLQINSIYRLVCSVLSINPSSHSIPEERMQNCIECIARLVSRSISAEKQNVDRVGLAVEDLRAFLNKVYLEYAIFVLADVTSQTLQQICGYCGSTECHRVVEFLVDKLCEFTNYVVPQAQVAHTSLSYRPFFKVTSDILLGPAKDKIFEHSSSIQRLLSKAWSLTARHSANDAEFVYAVLKLVHKIGTVNEHGHSIVMQARDSWKNVGSRYASMKRAANTSHGVALSTATTPHGGNHTNNTNNMPFDKNSASSITSFIMN